MLGLRSLIWLLYIHISQPFYPSMGSRMFSLSLYKLYLIKHFQNCSKLRKNETTPKQLIIENCCNAWTFFVISEVAHKDEEFQKTDKLQQEPIRLLVVSNMPKNVFLSPRPFSCWTWSVVRLGKGNKKTKNKIHHRNIKAAAESRCLNCQTKKF